MSGDNSVICLSEPILGQEERLGLRSVIDSGWITMGTRVAAFERAFAELHGLPDAVAVNSCTAGLHLCLAALEIGPEDEVLVPSLTFVATVNAVLYTGAKPVFVDIQKLDRPHISIEDAKSKISPRTKAVMVMHYGGYPVELPKWRTFADAYGLKLIEDAAHAPGAAEVGRWGDASAFSFFGNKNITTAEGGMVLTRNNDVLEHIRQMRTHGMTTATLDRHNGHAFSYDVTMLGYNYRMDELRAAIGLAQLGKLKQWNARRRELADCYRCKLAQSGLDILVPFEANDESVAHLMPAVLPCGLDRQLMMNALRKAGIQSSIHYPPVHQFSYYRNRFPGVKLSRTEEFCSREISLPLHPGLRERDVEMVVDKLSRAAPQCV